MKEMRLAIGGLLLPETPGWKFSLREHDPAIFGRPSGGPGLLQILHVPQETISQPVTHEFCILVASMVLKTDAHPSGRVMMESVCGPYGAATFVRTIQSGRWRGEQEVVRMWYCRRPPGLIYGLYFCRKSIAHGRAYERAMATCARIMANVLFDRPAWADENDPLTQVLSKNFERVENQNEPG